MKSSAVAMAVAGILADTQRRTTILDSALTLNKRLLEELEVAVNTPKPTPGATQTVDVEDDLPLEDTIKAIIEEFRKQDNDIEAMLKANTVEALPPEGPQHGDDDAEQRTTTTAAPTPPAPATPAAEPVNEAPASDDPKHDEPAKSDTAPAADTVDQAAIDAAMAATKDKA